MSAIRPLRPLEPEQPLSRTGLRTVPLVEQALTLSALPASQTRRVAVPLALSVAEAAELLGVSEWLVLQQIRRGLLPHRRVGRRIVLSRARLLAWLDAGDDTVEDNERVARDGAAGSSARSLRALNRP